MVKKSTENIQRYISELGRKLGFNSEIEHSIFTYDKDIYNPQYDVVWYLDITQYKAIQFSKYISDQNFVKLLEKVPIATFEIEGSTTTSKNQVGNFTNLYLSYSWFSFVIVNNDAAGNEKDTYRRAVKIQRTFDQFISPRNNFVLDWTHIKDFDVEIKNKDRNKIITANNFESREAVGGEKKSKKIYDKLMHNLTDIKLSVHQNWSPEVFKWKYEIIKLFQSITCETSFNVALNKEFVFDPLTPQNKRKISKAGDVFYIPKLDIAFGFYLPQSFIKFLSYIGKRLYEDAVHYPLLVYTQSHSDKKLFYPLITTEIETTASKHLNGGVVNMSKFSTIGLLFANRNAERNLNTLKYAFGIKNVFFNSVTDL